MDILTYIDDVAKDNPIRGAMLFCRGLMAHNESDPFRQGYTLGNALIAAQERFDLTGPQMAAVADQLVKPLLDRATMLVRFPDNTIAQENLRTTLEDFDVAP